MELLGITFAMLANGMAIELPPAWADHRPARPYTMEFVDQPEMDRHCAPVNNRLFPDPLHAYGCTDLAKRHVWILEGLPLDDAANVLRHEEGHLNGWMHD